MSRVSRHNVCLFYDPSTLLLLDRSLRSHFVDRPRSTCHYFPLHSGVGYTSLGHVTPVLHVGFRVPLVMSKGQYTEKFVIQRLNGFSRIIYT